MEICLREIAFCQQTGIQPNFIVLLGERYCWDRPWMYRDRYGSKKARYSGQAVVMHPARCHARNVPGAKLDGESGQSGQNELNLK